MKKYILFFLCPLKKPKGQILIESLILLPLTSACLILSLLFFFLYSQYLWMDHQLYQALLCSAKGRSSAVCTYQMQKKIKSFLWMGHITNIQIKKSFSGFKGFFIWKHPFWNLSFQKEIRL